MEKAGETFGQTTDRNKFYKADPLGKRTGNACDPKLLAVLSKTCDDAISSVSKKQAEMRVPLTSKLLREKIDNIQRVRVWRRDIAAVGPDVQFGVG